MTVETSETPGIYACGCPDGCERCRGTKTIAVLVGDAHKDAPVLRWLLEHGSNGFSPRIIVSELNAKETTDGA